MSHRFSLVYKVQCYHSLKSLSPQLLSQPPSDSEDGIRESTWLIQYALFQNSLFVHYQKTCSFFFEVWASGCSWKRNIRFNDHCSQQLRIFVQSIFLFLFFFTICSDSKHLLAVKEKMEREAQALLLRVRFQVMKNPLHSLICCLHGQDQKVHLKVDSISPLKLGRFIYRRRVMIFTSLTRVRDMQGFSNIF